MYYVYRLKYRNKIIETTNTERGYKIKKEESMFSIEINKCFEVKQN